MNFLYPNFLWALSAIAIPIIIHLFNFRKFKTIYFSNVTFLKNIKEQTKSKSQLKHLLVLLARILTIIALVIAFAQPYIPIDAKKTINSQSVVSIYIDNSFSMDAESSYGKLLEVAKSKAKEIADAYKPSTKFLLITNDMKPEHQHFINKEQLIDNISAIEISPNVKSIDKIISRQFDFMELTEKSSRSLYLLSDFQRASTHLNLQNPDSTTKINLMRLNAERSNNLFIDSCWFEIPARKFMQQEELFIKIINISGENYQNIPIKLYINDSLKTLGSFNIEANSNKTVSLLYQNTQKGIINGKIEITDYPITFDNTFYLNYLIADKIKVLTINNKISNQYFDALFKEDNYIELTNYTLSNINYTAFSGFQTIIINDLDSVSSGLMQELQNFVEYGGTLLFAPKIDGSINSYNQLLKLLSAETIIKLDTQKTKIKNINKENNLFKNTFKKIDENADLPFIKQHFVFSKTVSNNTQGIIHTRNKDAILNYTTHKKGNVYCLAIPVNSESSNFPEHPLFVPIVYNIVLNSNPSNFLYYVIGNNNAIELSYYNKNKTSNFSIVNNLLNVDFTPDFRLVNNNINLFLNNEITIAGNYLLNSNDLSLYGLAFNFNRNESNMECYNKDELTSLFAKNKFKNINFLNINDRFLTKSIERISKGIQLWKYFILLALLFILFEILLLRLWR